MSPIQEDELRRVLSVRDATITHDDTDLAATAIRSGRRTRRRRAIVAAGTSIAALAVAAAVAVPLLPRTVGTVPMLPATTSAPTETPSPSPDPTVARPDPPYDNLEKLPASWGDTTALAPERDGWSRAEFDLACQPFLFSGTPPFAFPALADLVAGQTLQPEDQYGPPVLSQLAFTTPEAATRFMAELKEQAQGCVDDKESSAADATRYGWVMEPLSEDRLLITLFDERPDTDGRFRRVYDSPATAMLFGWGGRSVVLAGDDLDPEGKQSLEEVLAALEKDVDELLQR